MGVKTYDPSKIHVLFGGIPISGFAEGSAVKVSRSEDTFKKVEGIGGHISRTRTKNKSGSIEFTLAQTSLSNDVLSLTAIADELSAKGVLPLLIIDASTSSVYVSAFAWIRKPAEAGYSKDLTNRTWIFDSVDVDMFTGGKTDDEATN